MADRYWVGGTGEWNSTRTANWSATSGGAGGASAPTSADNVIFDANSNSGTAAFTVAVTGTAAIPAACNDFTADSLDGSMTLLMNSATSVLNVFGSMTLPAANFTWTAVAGAVTNFLATTTGKTITTNGVSLGATGTINFNGAGGEWILGSALTTGSNVLFAVNQGTFDTGNFNITTGGFSSSGSLTRTINLGSSTITLSATNVITLSGSNLSWNVGTSTIVLTTASPAFAGGGKTFNNVTFSGGAGTKNISGANTFNGQFLASNVGTSTFAFSAAQNFAGGALFQGNSATIAGVFTHTGTATFTSAAHGTKSIGNNVNFQNLTITCPAVDGITTLTCGSFSVAGTLTTTDGGSTARRVQIVSTVVGFQRTLTVGTNSLINTDFQDINAAGTASWTFGLGYGDLGNNAGITFDSSTLYWIGGTGNWSSTTNWSTTSGGAAANAVPAPQNSVIFDAASNTGTGAFTVTGNAAMQCNDFSTGGAGGALDGAMTLTLGATAALNVYGSMTLPASNFAFSNTTGSGLNFRANTTGKTFTTNGVSVPTVAIAFNGAGGEWTLGSALTSGNINVFEGSLVSGNYNITYGSLITSGSSTRSISLGSSTLTGSGSSPVSYTGSNLTWNAGTSTINSSNASPTLAGAGLTFYNVSFTSTAIGTVTITGANTYNNLTFAARAAAGIGIVSIADNQTVTGTLTLGSGTTGVARLLVASSVIGTPRTLTVATIASLTDDDFRDIVAAGASAPWSGTRLGNCLGNSNITFDAPKTVYWNLAAGGSWNGTAWATSSGGTAALTNFPLAQDTAIIENTGLNTSATINGASGYNIGTINMSTRSNAMTYAHSSAIFRFYGNLVLSSAVTVTGTASFTFNGQGVTQQITTAGVTLPVPIIIDNATGTLQLQDNCTLASTVTTTLTSGTLDLSSGNRTLSTGIFSSTNTNTRSISFGTGKIVVTGNAATVFNMGTATNFTYTGTPTVEFNYSGSTGTRSIFGGATSTGGTESNALNFNITAGTDIVSIGTTINSYGTLNFTGFSGSVTSTGSQKRIYRNLIFSSTMSFSMAVSLEFIGTSTQQFTTNGITVDSPIIQNNPSATLQLQDNLTMGSTSLFTLTNGTLNLNSNTLTAGAVSSSNSNTRSINFGTNGLINCGNDFTATTGTGLTTAGRGRIKMNSILPKTFAGGGANYSAAALEQAGAGTLTITGASTFGDITNSNNTASQITFPASTNTFVRKFSVSGSSGNLVSLRSSVEGTQFTVQTV